MSQETKVASYYVKYEVKGLSSGPLYQGPYCLHDALEHKQDIEGYEEVFGADIVPEEVFSGRR